MVQVQKKCGKRIFGTRGSSVGFNTQLRKNSVAIQSPVFALPSSVDHASLGSSLASLLARVSQPGSGCGQPLPRVVCARGAQCCREKRHVLCGPIIQRLLTQASLLCGSLCRSLRCVCVPFRNSSLLCEYAGFSKHFIHIFRIRFVDVFFTFPHFCGFYSFKDCRRPMGSQSGESAQHDSRNESLFLVFHKF